MSARNREQMASRLEQAFANPRQKFCYYSGNGGETRSARLNAMPLWDWTPYRTHGGGGSTCIAPLAFGCQPVKISEDKEWIKPLITDPAQVHGLAVPDPRNGRTGEIIKLTAELVRTIPQGDRVRNPDIQSPLGIVELMWDESFYTALIEYPEAIHELLDKVTRFQIEYIRLIQQAAGDRYNPCGFPLIWCSGSGTMLADDTMSLISPAMHAEFSIPYVNRIAEAVGPLFYHSCTWRAPYFDNIRQVKNIRAFNWNPGNSDDPATLIREFSGSAVLALHLTEGMYKDHDVVGLGHKFADDAEFFEYCLDAMTEESSLYWWFLGSILQNGPVIGKIYDLLHERGYTPQAAGME
ncbi:MAG: hypothetical protein WAX69_22855 [Victivallales bacterium]